MSGAKAELPDLPASASPLEFGDWLHLCGPTMKDLSNQAARWWFLTTTQAKRYYEEWKEATPLQRVQIHPRLPEELHASTYARTEQRGVHLMLNAVSANQQQELVVDRDLNSTAIYFVSSVCTPSTRWTSRKGHLVAKPDHDAILQVGNGMDCSAEKLAPALWKSEGDRGDFA